MSLTDKETFRLQHVLSKYHTMVPRPAHVCEICDFCVIAESSQCQECFFDTELDALNVYAELSRQFNRP
jgi:hypothetical protein